MSFKWVLLIALFYTSSAVKVSYDGYRLYSVTPLSDNDIQSLENLKEILPVIFWQTHFKLDEQIMLMVPSDYQENFKNYMRERSIKIELKADNVQELIDRQLNPATTKKTSRSTGSLDWNSYHEIETIHAWLDELELLYPEVVRTVVMGTSNEGRDIKGVVIDFKPAERDSFSLHFMIEAGIHSREWISPASATWIINELLTGTDSEIREIAELFVWHIFPVVNPDGYSYTFTDDRMWRKTRNNASATTCGIFVSDDLSNGVDMNRNFDIRWMTIGASSNPCDQTYAGPSPMSEVESQAIANYVLSVQTVGNLMYYLAFHSYSQLLLVPPSDLTAENLLTVENYGDLFEIGSRAMDKLRERHGTNYVTGASTDILYSVSGSSKDWVKGVAGVPIVYLYEFRDLSDGPYGFLLPPDQIVPNSEEVMDSLVEMHKVAMKLGYYTSSSSILMSSLIVTVAALLTVFFCI